MEHVNIPDSELHQPKGAATAGASTVMKSDGAGGTYWSHPRFSELNDVNKAHPVADLDATDSDEVKLAFNELLKSLRDAGLMGE